MPATTGFTLVVATRIQDASGRLLASGRVTFFPTNNRGQYISAIAGGGGGLITQTGVTFLVVNGAITTDLHGQTPQIADTELTTPANICYRVSVTDANGAEVQGPGYGLIQPTGASFSLDTAVPNQPLLATIQTGPQGYSNYQLAQQNGFEGTLEEYLATLVGPAGANGIASLPALAAIYSRQPVGMNLYNQATIVPNSYIDPEGSLQSPNSSSTSSDFIPVQTGGSVSLLLPLVALGGNNTYSFYNENYIYVSGSTAPVSAGATLSVPSTAAFMRVCVAPGNVARQTIVNGTTAPTSYSSFGGAAVSSVPGLATAAISAVLAPSYNYFNPAAITANTLLDTPSGTTSSASGFYVSGRIPVQPSGSYTMAKGTPGASGNFGLIWYTGDGSIISYVNFPFTDGQAFTSPPDAAYVQFSGVNGSLAAQMWQLTSGYTGSYSPFAGAPNIANPAATVASTLALAFNYFDKSRVTAASIVSTVDGSTSSSSAWYTSAQFPVEPGVSYTMAQASAGSGNYGLVWLNGSGGFISGVNLPFTAGQAFVAPAGAAFVQFSSLNGTLNGQMWQVTAGASSSYVPFPGNSASTGVTAGEASFIQASAEALLPPKLNLFDLSRATFGYILSSTDGTTSANSNWYVSDFIPVKQGSTYTMAQGDATSDSGPYGLVWYDSTYSFLSSVPAPFVAQQQFVAPSGACFVRFPGLMNYNAGSFVNTLVSPAGQMWMEGTYAGPSPTQVGVYVPHLNAKINGKLAGVNVAVWGDSITGAFNQEWQRIFFGLTGANYVYQDARGGRTVQQIFEFYGNNPATGTNDNGTASGFTGPSGYGGTSSLGTGNVKYNTGLLGNTLAQDLTAANPALGIIFLLTNDASGPGYGGTPIGAYGDPTTAATVFGGVARAIEGIQTACPGVKLLWVTPYLSAGRYTNGYTNSVQAVVAAAKQVCADYGVAVLDLSSTLGINGMNASVMLRDGLHPADFTGYPRLARAIASFAEQFVP